MAELDDYNVSLLDKIVHPSDYEKVVKIDAHELPQTGAYSIRR